MYMVYKTPAGEYSALYADMLNQTHLLIAGATGSGKSTVVNGIIHAALFNSPARVQFILIDPKGTELSDYKTLPHVIAYAQEIPDCVKALQNALQLVKTRFQTMQKKHCKVYDGSDVYVIIDELMFLLNRPQYKRVAICNGCITRYIGNCARRKSTCDCLHAIAHGKNRASCQFKM